MLNLYPRFVSSSTENFMDHCNISMIIWQTCTNLHHLHNPSGTLPVKHVNGNDSGEVVLGTATSTVAGCRAGRMNHHQPHEMDPRINNNWSKNPLGIWNFSTDTMFTTKFRKQKICRLENDHGNLASNDRLNQPGGRIIIHLKSVIGVALSQCDVFPSNSLSVCYC